MKKEETQRHIVEFQIIDQQIKLLHQQLAVLEQQAVELTSSIENLESLKKVRPKTQAYAYLGPGIAVEAVLTEPNHVLMSVGAGAIVKKTLPEAQSIVQRQTEEIKKVAKNMEQELQRLMTHAQYLRKEIQKASQQ